MSDGCPVCGAARDGWPLCEECTWLVREAADHFVWCECDACGVYEAAVREFGYTRLDEIAGNTARSGA